MGSERHESEAPQLRPLGQPGDGSDALTALRTTAPVDWAAVSLPDAWPDQLDWRNPATTIGLVWRALWGSRKRVRLPDGLPGTDGIPSYVLQEFHSLPNGNYSKRISRGYARAFDRVMLGTLRAARARIATALSGAQHVLDVGCGGGHTAGALRAAGVPHVTGLDPCPYLLQFAAENYPGVTWLQATAEDTGLPEASADGVAVCFVFHEIPPRYLRAALAELRRIVRPGGRLAVIEPSPVQLRTGAGSLYRQYGWRGLYFRALALRAFEPFAAAWHAEDFAKLLAENQFRVEIDEPGCPLRFTLAVRE